MTYFLIAPIFLGWALGANGGANVFGTAVASKSVRYRWAVILTAIFVILGAWIDGAPGIRTMNRITSLDMYTAFLVTLGAAIVVTGMSALRQPVPTSPAVVGGIVGLGLLQHHVEWKSFIKIVLCWITTPLVAIVIAILLYLILRPLVNRIKNPVKRNAVIKGGLLCAGSYGAYALGANNVANVVGVFVGPEKGMLSIETAVLLGGVAIALGVLTYSKRVMMTVGKDLVVLDSFSALVAVFAEALTVYIYALIGIPVSMSQAIVGAVLGIGLLKGIRAIKKSTLRNIILAWFGTPLIAAGIVILLFLITQRFFKGFL